MAHGPKELHSADPAAPSRLGVTCMVVYIPQTDLVVLFLRMQKEGKKNTQPVWSGKKQVKPKQIRTERSG